MVIPRLWLETPWLCRLIEGANVTSPCGKRRSHIDTVNQETRALQSLPSVCPHWRKDLLLGPTLQMAITFTLHGNPECQDHWRGKLSLSAMLCIFKSCQVNHNISKIFFLCIYPPNPLVRYRNRTPTAPVCQKERALVRLQGTTKAILSHMRNWGRF